MIPCFMTTHCSLHHKNKKKLTMRPLSLFNSYDIGTRKYNNILQLTSQLKSVGNLKLTFRESDWKPIDDCGG